MVMTKLYSCPTDQRGCTVRFRVPLIASGLCVRFTFLLFTLLLPTPETARAASVGKVVDAVTGRPIEGAIVTLADEAQWTDARGAFQMKIPGNKVGVRARGYLKTEQALFGPQEIRLVPFAPRGLYLSVYGIGDRALRDAALKMIQETELNSLVIDVKGDRGLVPYKSSIPRAAEIGAQRVITVRDPQALIQSLKAKGIYTVARIVVFKDNLLALARPELAVRTAGGEIWRDRENLAWVDPFKKEVWEYNIQLAIEAALLGFDEIQFDYLRFPDSSAPRFALPSTEENRVSAISGFLKEARKSLLPYNVFLAADIFGYVCWNLNDTHIGQKLEALMPHADYLSPMLYPSGFQYGIPGYRNPVASPYEIVYLSLKKAQERTRLSAASFRPWLQAFRDYAFDRRVFNGKEIRSQIEAAARFGSQGWMLWNPKNIYSAEAWKKDSAPAPLSTRAAHSPTPSPGS